MNILEKKETKIIAVIATIVLLILAVILLYNQNNIKLIKTSLEHEAGQELVFDAQEYFNVDEDTAEQITFDTSKVDINTVGEYEVTAKYKNKAYTIQVKVVDTTAPKAELACRYLFTNNMAEIDLSTMFKSVQDASEYTTKLIRFERAENLKELDEKALDSLIEQINIRATDEELLALGAEEVPEDEGIYRVILEVADDYGNASYEEIVLILDMTGAKIEDTPDKTVTVSKENLTAELTVDKSEYSINDNVDGKIAAENIITELELRDEAKHEWLVHVSYVDRAGNESKADFLIVVKEAKNGSVQTGNSGATNKGNATSNQGGASNNGGSSNQNSSSDSDTNKKPSNNQDVSTWVPTDDEHDISPYEQMVIDAGYGNVVKFDNGNYGVLMKNVYHTIDGKDGDDILVEYLTRKGLSSTNRSGGWINEDNEWYMFIAKDVHELITPDEEEFWD